MAEPPHFERKHYTEEQRAMLEMLRSPAILDTTTIQLWHPKNAEREGMPGIAPAHTTSYVCPVVWVLGQRRAILPNGDVETIQSETPG